MKGEATAKKPAKKGLTEKQSARVQEIATEARFEGDPFDVNYVQAYRKTSEKFIRSLDKILAIIAPAKPKVEK
ncbi:MAG: hypothetical protein PHS14_08250 [Elusimicrobia bacterium]|nr:hypothetical protein [Elusimicrobiota bacterium]